MQSLVLTQMHFLNLAGQLLHESRTLLTHLLLKETSRLQRTLGISSIFCRAFHIWVATPSSKSPLGRFVPSSAEARNWRTPYSKAMELETEGSDSELLSFHTVEVLQAVSVKNLRDCLSKVKCDLKVIAEGPVREVEGLKDGIGALKAELEDARDKIEAQGSRSEEFGQLLARLEKSELERQQVSAGLTLYLKAASRKQSVSVTWDVYHGA